MAVSIILLVHDRDKFLEKILENLCDSTYKNFEINIFESANLDSTFKILNKFRHLLDIKCYHLHLKYVDKTKCLNYLISKSNYDIISIYDTDILKPNNYLENSLKNLNENNFIMQNAIYFNEETTNLIFSEKLNYNEIKNKNLIQKSFLKTDGSSQITIYKKNLNDIGNFDEFFFKWAFEDSDLLERLKNFKKQCILFEEDGFHLYHNTKNNFRCDRIQTEKNKEHYHKNKNEKVIFVKNENINRDFNKWDINKNPERVF